MAKTIAGKVIAVEFDVDVEKQAGGSYKAWSLSFRDASGKNESITKPMAGLKFQPNLKAVLQELKAGDEFVAEMEKNKNGYFEVSNISKGGSLPTSVGADRPYRTDRMARAEGDDARQVSIVRQSSLKAAVDFATRCVNAEDMTAEGVTEIAAVFEAWVTRKDSE